MLSTGGERAGVMQAQSTISTRYVILKKLKAP